MKVDSVYTRVSRSLTYCLTSLRMKLMSRRLISKDGKKNIFDVSVKTKTKQFNVGFR